MSRLVFLDIDGVLNHDNAFMFHPENVAAFNRIIRETGAEVVISSSWRSMIHGGFMTFAGFGMMLLTHRVRCKVIGATPRGDEHANRAWEIAAWIKANKFEGQYLVLDDDDDGILGRHPFVQTEPLVALTEANADEAIKMLKGES